ncbi:MAG: DUF433 domain-containing protein [Patescibacteria group bacterium]
MNSIKKELKHIIYKDKEILGGTPCFVGTRVPVATILEYLSLGWSINELKESYPTVKTEHIAQLLSTLSSEFQAHAKVA